MPHSPNQLLELIQSAKNQLKKDRTFRETCKEYQVSPEIIDLIPVRFGELDVSAKTEKGIVTLNKKLLDGKLSNILQYLLHEATHFLQQSFEGPTQGASDGEYLENPVELEAFQNQISFLDDHHGPEKAVKYVDHLLDHHEIDNPDERAEKKQELLEKIDRK
jgi:hypothetical protein